MERLTEHSKQTSHENGICCTYFRGPECLEVGGNCAMNCKWEEAAWSRLAAYEDKELETKARGGSYYAKNEDQSTTNFIAQQSCLTLKDMHDYLHAQRGYGWHITDLRIYDAPRELSEFLLACPNSWYCESCAMYWENNGTCGNESLQIKHAPQSWCYVEAMEDV